AAVCVNYTVHADAAEAVVAEIAIPGGRAIAVAADVADSAAVETMVARTEAELGPVTILVNNAGVAWQGTLDTYDREQVARMRQVNVDGVIHATRAVIGSSGRSATAGLSTWPRLRGSARRSLAMHSMRQRRPR